MNKVWPQTILIPNPFTSTREKVWFFGEQANGMASYRHTEGAVFTADISYSDAIRWTPEYWLKVDAANLPNRMLHVNDDAYWTEEEQEETKEE